MPAFVLPPEEPDAAAHQRHAENLRRAAAISLSMKLHHGRVVAPMGKQISVIPARSVS